MSKIKISGAELNEKLVNVGRTAKVVKGGRRFNFSAIVVVGDGNGHVGYGLGKASEVSDAMRKATEAAKRNIYKVTLQNGTLPHEVIGRYGAAKVLFRPATAGTGIIAAGAVRAVLELCGVKDVLTKNLGTSNPHNTVKAAIKGLASLENAVAVAERRGVSTEKVIRG